jgi:hypothetical protein
MTSGAFTEREHVIVQQWKRVMPRAGDETTANADARARTLM